MAERVRSFDWSRTPLGPLGHWPQSLRTLVDLLLSQPIPMIILWGPDLTQIYNDAYAVVAAKKHPAALGQPNRECWPEALPLTEPIYERVLNHGERVLLDDQLIPLDRYGRNALQDAYFTVSYSPCRDDEGLVGGIFVTVVETTAKVLAERERERGRAEEAVRTAEELHQGAAEAGRVGSWSLRLDDRECAVSPVMAELMGLPRGQTTATVEQWIELVYPDDVSGLKAALLAATGPDARLDHQFRVVHSDGTQRWLHWQAALRAEPGGGAVRLRGAAVDVTERKLAEEQLQRSHETFYRLIQNDPFGGYVVETDFRQRRSAEGVCPRPPARCSAGTSRRCCGRSGPSRSRAKPSRDSGTHWIPASRSRLPAPSSGGRTLRRPRRTTGGSSGSRCPTAASASYATSTT